jgi:hypothetical protein
VKTEGKRSGCAATVHVLTQGDPQSEPSGNGGGGGSRFELQRLRARHGKKTLKFASSRLGSGIAFAAIAAVMGKLFSRITRVLAKLLAWASARPRFTMVCAGVLLIGGFYGEENWRGKRAWESCKRDLERRGAQLDWADLNPAPVPDSQNFFKAPKMMDWFGGSPNTEIAEKLSLGDLAPSAGRRNTNAIAEVKLVSPEASIGPGEADLVLSYGGTLSLAEAAPGTASSAAASVVIPLIVMDDVPLTDAIRNLARQADLQYKIDPRTGLDGAPNQPAVSARWSDLTARQALTLLLRNHGLQLVKGPPGCKMRIVRADQGGAIGFWVEPDVRAKLIQLLCSASERAGNHLTLRALTGSQNLGLFAHPLNPMNPVRIVVRTDAALSHKEVARFFSGVQFTHLNQEQVTVELVQEGHYRICLGPSVYYTAEDYLAWSDRIGPELEALRRALQRPCAWIESESRRSIDSRVPNFVSVRLLAQTLGQRAQCHILLDQPEGALQELKLLHDLSRIVTRKPVTLVGAMINVALTGVYVQVVTEGLRLGVWQGPQLAEIQRQLESVNLVESVVAAFQCERLIQLTAFESGHLGKLMVETQMAFAPPAAPDLFRRLMLASYRLVDLVPKGWLYRNMATVGSLDQEYLDAVEPGRGVILPRGIDAAAEHTQSLLKERRVETFIAGIAFPIFTRAWQTTAQTQASVRQAMTVCALQRYQIMKGAYPQALGALAPEFVKEVALDPVTGERMHYRPDSRSNFLLYSVGWNGVDEGGKVCYAQGGGVGAVNGDWVWDASPLR